MYKLKHKEEIMTPSLEPEKTTESTREEIVSATDQAQQLFVKYRATLRNLGMELAVNRDQANIQELSFLRPDLQINEKAQSATGVHINGDSISLSVEDVDQMLYFFKHIEPKELGSLPAKSALTRIATELDGLIVKTFIKQSLSEEEKFLFLKVL